MKKNHNNRYYDKESLTPFAFPAIFVSCMIVASFFLLSGGQNSNATKDVPHNVKVVQVAVNDNVDKSTTLDSKNTNDNKDNSNSHVSNSDTGENQENSLESKDSTEDSNESLNNNSFDSDKKSEASTGSDSEGVKENEKKNEDSKSSNVTNEADNQSNNNKYQSEMVKQLEADPNAHMNKDGNWYVVVKPGDTLTSISRKYGYSVDQLAQFNKIQNVNLIYVNSSIVLPSNK